jgi:hypothetical protein
VGDDRDVPGRDHGGYAVRPREPQEWTVEDLDALPDDDNQYELLDGLLLQFSHAAFLQ